MYYCIEYFFSEEINGIYQHLPVTSQVTQDLKVAEKWYEDAKKVRLAAWRGNILHGEEIRTLSDKWFYKQAKIECKESGNLKGFYLINLASYSTINPCE